MAPRRCLSAGRDESEGVAHARPNSRNVLEESRVDSPRIAPPDRLELFGLPETLVGLLRFVALHPRDRVHLRGLEQLFGKRSASFQRDLQRLVELGALRRVEHEEGSGRRVFYEVAHAWPLWPTIRSLLVGLSDPAALVREAIRDVEGIEAAFVYGSEASGTARPDSDVDVFVFGDHVDTRALHGGLMEVSLLLGRQVNPAVYTRMKLAERLARPDAPSRGFLRDVLGGPKAWVAGAVEALAPIAVAAGIAASAVAGLSATGAR